MKASSSVASAAIERVLELSADAHVERRMMAEESAAFERLTGTIAAYGKTLALLLALQESEELFAMIEELDAAEFVTGPIH